MELEDFITKTLLSIKKGINNTNIQLAKLDGKVLGVDESIQYEISKNKKGIHFDIAITVSNKDGLEGQGKINVAIIDINGTKSSSSLEEKASRISFEVEPFRSVH